MRCASCAAALLFCSNAVAHAGHAGTWWTFDPWVWGGCALLFLLRPRRPWRFAAAAAALFLALIWPLDVLSQLSFAAHMAQHMLLIGVAAPLLVLSRPSLRLIRGNTWASLGSRTSAPRAFALHAAAIWLGHAPLVIAWTLAYRWVHIVEHATLLGTAMLFWWALCRRGRAGYGEAALWSLATMIHTGILGALLTFAPRVLYSGYALEDQQLAGLVMWVPGGACYLVAGLAFGSAWLSKPGCASVT